MRNIKILAIAILALLAFSVSVFAKSPTQKTAEIAQQQCSPSYPDFCIAPPPPDLNCKDISRKNFRVLPPDPHGFDRDKDGIGCES